MQGGAGVRRWLGALWVAVAVSGLAHAQTPDAPPADTWRAVVQDRVPPAGATVAWQVVRVDTGEEIAGRGADRALTPASTAKLFTTAAALRVLGPSHTWPTRILRTGDIVDGVVQGDLVLQLSGDPTLQLHQLWRLLRDVRAQGVTGATGRLLLDTRAVGGGPQIPGWDNRDDLAEGPSYFPAIGASAIEFGAIVVAITPTAAGEPARVAPWIDAAPYLGIAADVVTGPPRSRASLTVSRAVTDGAMALSISGTVPEDGGTELIRRAVADPDAYLRAVLGPVLREVGLSVRAVALGASPAQAGVLAERSSPPLASVLMDVNKYSSNFMAEMVLRAVGGARGAPTTEGGLAAVRDVLDDLGIGETDVTMANGSGLSRASRATPAALCAVLVAMARDPSVGAEFSASLSIGGIDGTLRRRLEEPEIAARGKTGTLGGVHTVAGYVHDASGTRYAFAVLLDGVRTGASEARAWTDDLLRAVVKGGG